MEPLTYIIINWNELNVTCLASIGFENISKVSPNESVFLGNQILFLSSLF